MLYDLQPVVRHFLQISVSNSTYLRLVFMSLKVDRSLMSYYQYRTRLLALQSIVDLTASLQVKMEITIFSSRT